MCSHRSLYFHSLSYPSPTQLLFQPTPTYHTHTHTHPYLSILHPSLSLIWSKEQIFLTRALEHLHTAKVDYCTRYHDATWQLFRCDRVVRTWWTMQKYAEMLWNVHISSKGHHALSSSEPRLPKSSYDWAGDANYQAKLPRLQLSIWFCQTICSVVLAVIVLASISQVSLPRLADSANVHLVPRTCLQTPTWHLTLHLQPRVQITLCPPVLDWLARELPSDLDALFPWDVPCTPSLDQDMRGRNSNNISIIVVAWCCYWCLNVHSKFNFYGESHAGDLDSCSWHGSFMPSSRFIMFLQVTHPWPRKGITSFLSTLSCSFALGPCFVGTDGFMSCQDFKSSIPERPADYWRLMEVAKHSAAQSSIPWSQEQRWRSYLRSQYNIKIKLCLWLYMQGLLVSRASLFRFPATREWCTVLNTAGHGSFRNLRTTLSSSNRTRRGA